YEDEETGLCYNRYRYYDPELGRFISADPVGLRGGANVFSYAPNAVTWSDPLGLTGEQGRRECLAWNEASAKHALDRRSPHRPAGDDGKGTEFPSSWSESEYLTAVEQKANDPNTTWAPVPAERGGVGRTAFEPITINGETRRIFIVAEVPDPNIPGTGAGVLTSAFPRHKNR